MTNKNDVKERVLDFRQARQWPQQETVEQLAQMLVDEAAEVRDYAQAAEHMPLPGLRFADALRKCGRDWLGKTSVESYRMMRERESIAPALADVGICLLAFCDRLNINLENEMEAKLETLTDKYPTELDLSLQALAENPHSAAEMPFDSLLLSWRNDDQGVDWDAVARSLTPDQRQWMCLTSPLDWDVIFDISRNLEKTDRQGITAVINTGASVALEELLTYDLDLSDEEFATICQRMKQSGWRDLSEADMQEIRASLQTSGSWIFSA